MRTVTRTVFMMTLALILLGCDRQPADGPATDPGTAQASEDAAASAEPRDWKEAAKQGWQNARDVAAETRDAAAETAEKVADKVKESGLDEKAKELAEGLKETASDALVGAGEALGDAKERYSGEVYDKDAKVRGPSYTGTRNNPDPLKD